MRSPMMSGWCSTPSPGSHSRCTGGNRANPNREFQPCPCSCHFGEEYDCGNCGGVLYEAPTWVNDEYPDEMVYTHVKHGRGTGEECP